MDRTGQDRTGVVKEETGSETDCGPGPGGREAVRDGRGGAAVVGGDKGERGSGAGGGKYLERVGG